jgi:hypothetical protein
MDPYLFDVYQSLAKRIVRRFQASRVELLSVAEEPVLISDMVQLFTNAAIEFAYLSDEFSHRYPEEEHHLETIYRAELEVLGEVLMRPPHAPSPEQDFAKQLRDHAGDLEESISPFFDPAKTVDEFENLVLQRAVSSSYTPGFQLRLMEIDPARLQQPVLDIGCGQAGELVSHLLDLGSTAYGVDLLAEPSPHLMRTDWLALDLLPNTWGTIISHVAFSNHFTFHHHYRNGDPEAYARLYTRILAALKPGGSFIYTPGLPFIEPFVPGEQYRITRQDLIQPQDSETGFSGLPQDDFWYATKITRL